MDCEVKYYPEPEIQRFEAVPDRFIERLRETVKFAESSSASVRARLAKYNGCPEEKSCCDPRIVERNCQSEFFRQCFDLVEQIGEHIASVNNELAESEV